MDFSISLNSYTPLLPDTNVEGKVSLVLETTVDIESITVQIIGEESTSWTAKEPYFDNHDKITKSKTVQYEGERKFLGSKKSLIGRGFVGPGSFEYPFIFTLPRQLPSTFKTTTGEIKYYVKATVKRPNEPDETKDVDFDVTSPIDFNTKRDLITVPTQYETNDDFTSCFLPGAITMTAYLDKTAYIVGETIRFKVQLVNRSWEDVLALDVQLKMIIKTIATEPNRATQYTEEVLASLQNDEVIERRLKNYDLSLVVPSNPIIPNLESCSLFRMWGLLAIEALTTGPKEPLGLRVKLALGHIPKRTTPRSGISGFLKKIQTSIKSGGSKKCLPASPFIFPSPNPSPTEPSSTACLPEPTSFRLPETPSPSISSDPLSTAHDPPSLPLTPSPPSMIYVPGLFVNAISQKKSPSPIRKKESSENEPSKNTINILLVSGQRSTSTSRDPLLPSDIEPNK